MGSFEIDPIKNSGVRNYSRSLVVSKGDVTCDWCSVSIEPGEKYQLVSYASVWGVTEGKEILNLTCQSCQSKFDSGKDREMLELLHFLVWASPEVFETELEKYASRSEEFKEEFKKRFPWTHAEFKSTLENPPMKAAISNAIALLRKEIKVGAIDPGACMKLGQELIAYAQSKGIAVFIK